MARLATSIIAVSITSCEVAPEWASGNSLASGTTGLAWSAASCPSSWRSKSAACSCSPPIAASTSSIACSQARSLTCSATAPRA